MSHRHAKKKTEEQKQTPKEQRISTVQAIKNLYDLMGMILCELCENKDTCVNRATCPLYADLPPNCPSCGEVMDKYGNVWVCTQCSIEDLKKKRMEELS